MTVRSVTTVTREMRDMVPTSEYILAAGVLFAMPITVITVEAVMRARRERRRANHPSMKGLPRK